MNILRKKLRRFRKKLFSTRNKASFGIGAIALVLLIVAIYSYSMPKNINPIAYKPLLEIIAEGESNGNYNAYFGAPSNTSLRLTDMTIAEVVNWQKQYVASGMPSNAVGRYQIIQPTLEGLINELNIEPTEKFDETLQDTMAIALLERRGSKEFVKEEVTAEEFAASLAKEWAALPKVVGDNPADSYYSGDGLNQSRIPINKIMGAVEAFKKQADSE